MTATTSEVGAPLRTHGPGWRQRIGRATPFLLLAPGILWLLIFFVVPSIQMFLTSVSTGSVDSGFRLTFSSKAYETAFTRFPRQLTNSLVYGGLATILTFLIGFPVAYTIAFRGGRYKSLLLFLVIAPFFTSFLIRTISWKILLNDAGPVIGPLKEAGLVSEDFGLLYTPIAVVAGITYNFLPFMVLPLYVALEKVDHRLVEAATDLYASRTQAFLRVTLPLSMPGVFAGSLLTFIPAVGDFVNAQILGSPSTRMIGNVTRRKAPQ
jgi:spermidine/putrescine transport system permease protein